MTDKETAEFLRISMKLGTLMFLRVYGDTPESEINPELLLTQEEKDFHDKWLPYRLELGSKMFAEKYKEESNE